MESLSKLEDDPQNYKTTGVAARVGDLVGLQTMVWSGRPVDVFDNRGWSPLHEAAAKGYSGCLEYLLRQEGSDPNWKSHMDETPVHLASRNGHYQCLRALINAKARLNVVSKDGMFPLFDAVRFRSNDCIRLLVRKGAALNRAIITGYTPLHQAARMGNHQVTSYLLQQGALQNLRCQDGLTPLSLAVQRGSVETVRVLLNRLKETGSAHDNVVNIAAKDNATPLLLAAQGGREEIVDLLLQHGADPNIQVTAFSAGPLQYAVYCNRPKCVEKLLPVTDLLTFDTNFSMMHPLVQSLGHADTTILELLLEAGVNPAGVRPVDADQMEDFEDLVDDFVEADWKASLLCYLPPDGGAEAFRLLLDQGLSPNADQDKELPPLLVAMARKNRCVASLLLRYGARPNVYVSGQNTAMLFALFCDLGVNSLRQVDVSEENGSTAEEQPMVVDGADRHQWLESCRNTFLLLLFAAGGEVETMLRTPVGERLNLLAVLCRAWRSFAAERRQAMVAALLGLLLCLSSRVETLHQDLLALLSLHQAKELNCLAEKTGTLAHLCRRLIFRHLCTKKQKVEDAVATLGLPEQVCDYLLFPELEAHSRTLTRHVFRSL